MESSNNGPSLDEAGRLEIKVRGKCRYIMVAMIVTEKKE